MNYGIDFRGGSLIEVQADSGDGRRRRRARAAARAQLGDVQVQEFGSIATC